MSDSVGRMELFARLGRINIFEGMVKEAALEASDREWRRLNGERLATSVYASKFPGGPRACERQVLYDLMNFPAEKAMPPMVSATAIVGKAVEDYEVRMLEDDGRLLSTGADSEDQIRIEDNDHWISGRTDLVVLPKFWNRPLLVEKKTKDGDVVDEMRALKRSYDPYHGYQARVYIAILRSLSSQLWPAAVVCKHTWKLPSDDGVCRVHGNHDCLIEINLEPITSGVVSYSSRNRPNVSSSWWFEHDEEWWQRGLAVLDRVKHNFENDVLPPQPFGGKQWSAQPCQWCNHKRNTCKPDHVAGVDKLTESHGAEWAKGVFGQYDPDAIRAKVLDRWRGRTGYSYTLPPGYEIGRNGVQKERVNV